MNRAHGLVLSSLISLAAGCDAELCPAFEDLVFEDVDAKEAPEPYRIAGSHERDVEFEFVSEDRAVEISGAFEVTRVRSQTRVTCDSSEPRGYVVDALADFADADDALSFALPVQLYLSEDEASDPQLAFVPGVYAASEYPITLPLAPEAGWRLAGVRTTHESNAEPVGSRMILEAWWVAEDCDNPNTCPNEAFDMVGSMPMDRIVFENALLD